MIFFSSRTFVSLLCLPFLVVFAQSALANERGAFFSDFYFGAEGVALLKSRDLMPFELYEHKDGVVPRFKVGFDVIPYVSIEAYYEQGKRKFRYLARWETIGQDPNNQNGTTYQYFYSKDYEKNRYKFQHYGGLIYFNLRPDRDTGALYDAYPFIAGGVSQMRYQFNEDFTKELFPKDPDAQKRTRSFNSFDARVGYKVQLLRFLRVSLGVEYSFIDTKDFLYKGRSAEELRAFVGASVSIPFSYFKKSQPPEPPVQQKAPEKPYQPVERSYPIPVE